MLEFNQWQESEKEENGGSDCEEDETGEERRVGDDAEGKREGGSSGYASHGKSTVFEATADESCCERDEQVNCEERCRGERF